MSLQRVHLINSAEKHKDGTDVIADCGKLVPRAVAVFTLDDEGLCGSTEKRGIGDICVECYQIGQAIHEGFRYTSGLVPAELAPRVRRNEEA